MEDFSMTQLDNRIITFILNLISNKHRTDELKLLINNIENNINNDNFIFEIYSDNENINILEFIVNSVEGSSIDRNIRIFFLFKEMLLDILCIFFISSIIFFRSI